MTASPMDHPLAQRQRPSPAFSIRPIYVPPGFPISRGVGNLAVGFGDPLRGGRPFITPMWGSPADNLWHFKRASFPSIKAHQASFQSVDTAVVYRHTLQQLNFQFYFYLRENVS